MAASPREGAHHQPCNHHYKQICNSYIDCIRLDLSKYNSQHLKP